MRMRLNITTRHDPLCPICRRGLLDYTVQVRHDVAWCPACIHADNILDTVAIASILKHALNVQDTTTAHGVTWWTPRAKPPVGVRLLIDHGNPDYLRQQIGYVVQPPYAMGRDPVAQAGPVAAEHCPNIPGRPPADRNPPHDATAGPSTSVSTDRPALPASPTLTRVGVGPIFTR